MDSKRSSLSIPFTSTAYQNNISHNNTHNIHPNNTTSHPHNAYIQSSYGVSPSPSPSPSPSVPSAQTQHLLALQNQINNMNLGNQSHNQQGNSSHSPSTAASPSHSPSSSPSHPSSSPSSSPPPSLTGFLNLSHLESIFQHFHQTIESHSAALSTLHSQMVSSPHHHSLQSRVEDIYSEFSLFKSTYTPLIQQMSSHVNDMKSNISHYFHGDGMKKLLTEHLDDLLSSHSEYKYLLQLGNFNDFMIKYKGKMDHLEEFSSNLHKEMSVFQSLLFLKMDRSELPLLQNYHDKISELMEYKEKSREDIKSMEEKLNLHEKSLHSKESKENMVIRMNKINDLISSKMDKSEWDHFLQTEYKNHKIHIDTTHHKYSQHHEEKSLTVQKCQHDVDTMRQQLGAFIHQWDSTHKPVIEKYHVGGEYHSKLNQMVQKVEREHKDVSSKCDMDIKMQSALIGEMKMKWKEMEGKQKEMGEKVGVALRFIEWFTEVKLKGQ